MIRNLTNTERVVAIDSNLGWIALQTREDCVLRLSLGHDSPASAVAAVQGDDLCDPTPWEAALLERLQAYAEGSPDAFDDLHLDLSGRTEFQTKVLTACRQIPHGETVTYQELAGLAGSPRAYRAVGNVMASNRTPLLIPCHRVVARGKLGGFTAPQGVSMKRRLLRLEGAAYECAGV